MLFETNVKSFSRNKMSREIFVPWQANFKEHRFFIFEAIKISRNFHQKHIDPEFEIFFDKSRDF